MKILQNDDQRISKVVLRGVKPAKKAGDLEFTLELHWGKGDRPTVSVVPYADHIASRSKDGVEMDDCFPLEMAFRNAISGGLVAELMLAMHRASAVLESILAILLAPESKLEVQRLNDGGGFLFVLEIGFFRTTAVVQPERVKRYLVPESRQM